MPAGGRCMEQDTCRISEGLIEQDTCRTSDGLFAMSKKSSGAPFRVGWHPDWIYPDDKSLAWPSWEYERKADAIADAKAASRSTRVPVVVYNGKLEIISTFSPKGECVGKPPDNKEIVEKLRLELMNATV